MKNNRLLIYLGGAVLLLIIIAVVGKQQGWIGQGTAIKVSTEKAAPRTIVETVSASGKIFPEVEVKISPDVSGEIVELHVEEGDSVKEGDLLVKIKPDIYVAAMERAGAALNTSRANYHNSKARLAQVKAQFENAKSTHERNIQLHREGVISDADFETSEATFKSAEADLEAAQQSVVAAQYNVKSAEATLKEARDNLMKTSIYAPVSGIISKLDVEKGERVVGTLQMAGTEMLRIADLNNMEAQVEVSENDVVRVAIRDTVEIEVDAYLDRKFKGVVTEIANSANTANQLTSEQVTNFTVKIRLLRSSYKDLIAKEQGNQFPFRPGMSCAVEIQTERAADVLAVPIQAVTTREEDAKSDSTKTEQKKDEIEEVVFRYKNDKVEQVTVKTGIQDDTYIRILDGLSEGDEVVSAPYSAISRRLEDGDEVQKVKKDRLFEDEEN